MSRVIIYFLLSLFPISLSAQHYTDDLNLNSRLEKIPKTALFELDDYYSWCPSVIKGEDGKFHLFYSRWPHGKRDTSVNAMNYIFDEFGGWMMYSEIAHAVSDRLEGPYKHVNTILKGDGDKNRWDRFTMHNPQIRKFGKKFYLYYVSNNYNPNYYLANISKESLEWLKYNTTQCTGVLVANSLDDMINGKFQKVSEPLICPDNLKTFEVTNNPSVIEGPDHTYYMMFKSRTPTPGHMTMWIATSKTPIGPFSIKSAVFTDKEFSCEDPCIWYDKARKRFYAVAKNFTNSGNLTKQFGALVLLTSKDGIGWGPAIHTLVSNKQLAMNNGEIVELENLERPFVFTDIQGKALAILAAARRKKTNGTDGKVLQNSFDVIIPLKN